MLLNTPVLRLGQDVAFRMNLSSCGRYLATYVTVSQGLDLRTSSDKRLLTLRKFITPEQVVILHQQQLFTDPPHPVIVKNLYVDSRYVILFQKKLIESLGETVEIRSIETLQILHSIALPLSSILLHYSSGFLMLSLLNSSVIK